MAPRCGSAESWTKDDGRLRRAIQPRQWLRLLGLGSSYQGVISGVVLVIAAAIHTVGKYQQR
jgi:hypothetical protein